MMHDRVLVCNVRLSHSRCVARGQAILERGSRSVPRRKAWNGKPPETEAAARRFLLDITQQQIERFGLAKVSLSDVAEAAGVTRQTVYRHFPTADDLFNAAAVLASGGFLQRMRARARKRRGVADRFVETLVIAIREIPGDAHLDSLLRTGDALDVSSALKLGFVQEEMVALSEEGELTLGDRERDELSELLLRLLKSFLDDPGPARSEEELRAFFHRWLIPVLEEKLAR